MTTSRHTAHSTVEEAANHSSSAAFSTGSTKSPSPLISSTLTYEPIERNRFVSHSARLLSDESLQVGTQLSRAAFFVTITFNSPPVLLLGSEENPQLRLRVKSNSQPRQSNPTSYHPSALRSSAQAARLHPEAAPRETPSPPLPRHRKTPSSQTHRRIPNLHPLQRSRSRTPHPVPRALEAVRSPTDFPPPALLPPSRTRRNRHRRHRRHRD